MENARVIALGSDMDEWVARWAVDYLKEKGYQVRVLGALNPNEDPAWTAVGSSVGQAVANREADFGILFCWTGTGVSIAANKVKGVRAALCTDAGTASGAREWNDANVLCMSLRLISKEMCKEIIDAFLVGEVSDDLEDRALIDEIRSY
jgi:ribose 5-phosphate isomerase B